jgi:hypothetical protein
MLTAAAGDDAGTSAGASGGGQTRLAGEDCIVLGGADADALAPTRAQRHRDHDHRGDRNDPDQQDDEYLCQFCRSEPRGR